MARYGASEESLRGARVRILAGDWAGQEGNLMRGDYGFDGKCVKLDPQHPVGVGNYVEVFPENIELIPEGN